MNEIMTINKLTPGFQAVVCALHNTGSMRQRLLDIGLIENTKVECIRRSPSGDPSAYLIRGAVIAIRAANSKNIIVSEYTSENTKLDFQPFNMKNSK